jgi:hypothetical protein
MRAENVDFLGEALMVFAGLGQSRTRRLERSHRGLSTGAELAQILVGMAELPLQRLERQPQRADQRVQRAG